ncbi:Uncharacterised protein [Capnocytophaga canimorsus]|nr:Uncharacterised protein [Capnocytophaga canimorsus]
MLFYFKFYSAKLKIFFIKEKFRFCFLKFPLYLILSYENLFLCFQVIKALFLALLYFHKLKNHYHNKTKKYW